MKGKPTMVSLGMVSLCDGGCRWQVLIEKVFVMIKESKDLNFGRLVSLV